MRKLNVALMVVATLVASQASWAAVATVGFETGETGYTFGLDGAATAAVSTAQAHSGQYSAKLQLSNGSPSTDFAKINVPFSAPLDQTIMSCWAYVPSSNARPDLAPYPYIIVDANNNGSYDYPNDALIITWMASNSSNDAWFPMVLKSTTKVHVVGNRSGLGATEFSSSHGDTMGTLADLRAKIFSGSTTWGSLNVILTRVGAGEWPGAANYVAYVDDIRVETTPINRLVSPASLAPGKPQFSAPHGGGTNAFAYDWDSAAPTTASGAPTGYGASSFSASVNEGGATQPDRYRTFRVALRSLFGQNVAIGQIARISYQTKKPAAQTEIDWRMSIYTTWDPAGGNSSGWYRSRIQSHPAGAAGLSAPADTWNLWSTSAGANQLQFSSNRSGFAAEDIAFGELNSGAVTRGASTWNFSGEEVMMIDLTMGANSGGGTGASQLDAAQIELTSGQVANIDLTAGTAWQVATVHGFDQFTIADEGASLAYTAQPRNSNAWYWYQNNGSSADTLATGGFGPEGHRDGSRTFACSDVAVGKKLNEIKLVFDYITATGYPTINFFMTDGSGKFGIFAPTSLGIGTVGGTVVLDATWTRMTIDLTSASIPDASAVAVYEHNGFTNVYGDPFTTMTWGDIKNYTIAGMYDYQRSPARGWQDWGTMFRQVNAAGDDSIVNSYGLALIWGDTVGNASYVAHGIEIRNVEVSFADAIYSGTFVNAQMRDILELQPTAASLYIKPGEGVVVNMNVRNLRQKVNACQAMLGYSTSFFQNPTGGSVQASGSGPWDQIIWDSWVDGPGGVPSEIDAAIGVNAAGLVGTDTDNTVCKVLLTSKTGIGDGTTKLVFRSDAFPDPGLIKSTFLSDMAGQPVWPTKLDSVNIVVDGTAPVITCPAAATVSCGASTDPPATGVATATDAYGPITITWTDSRAGLNGCNATGTIVRTWTATDGAGNASTCAQNIIVQDAAPPVITGCPANIITTTDPGLCTAVVNFAAPTATDSCYMEGFEDAAFVAGSYVTAPSVNWNEYNSPLSRVATGTDGIASKSGGAHAVVDSTSMPIGETGIFSRLRGYSSSFGIGWKASLDVYINLADPAVAANTYGWDVSVASSNQSGTHLRDFIFHAAADDSAPGNVLIAGSNNSNGAKRNDLDTLNHYTVASTGWYTLEWVFRDNAGVLAVDLNLHDAAGLLLWTETRSAPSDLIATVVGGNNYMWFTFLAVNKLAIDNTQLIRNVPVVCTPPSGSVFAKGTTAVNCNATDACGNPAVACSFTVTVNDAELPTITCPANTTIQCSASTDPSNTGVPIAADNCDTPVLTYADSSSTLVNPANMDGWTMFVTTSYSNTPGGDGIAEMVNGPATPPMGAGSARLFTGTNGEQSAQLRNSSWAGTRMDALTSLKYSTYATSWNGQQLPYLTIWVDTDGDSSMDDRLWFEPDFSSAGAGNGNPNPQPPAALNTWQTWDCLAGMWYSDTVAGPGSSAITLAAYLQVKPNATIVNASGSLGGIRVASGFASPGDVFDAYVDAFTIGTAASTAIYNFELGGCANRVITRLWTATDLSGNAATCSQSINVVDTQGPVITVPANITVPNDAGLCSAVVNLIPATATDCDPAPYVSGARSDSQPLSAAYPVGTTTITWTATDACGNSSTASQAVTVTDAEAPVIAITSATQGALELLGGGAPNAVVGVVAITVTASDQCALVGNPAVTVTPFGGAAEAATFVNQSPTGTFHYTWAVTASTPNGLATIDAGVADAAPNAAAAMATFNINKHEIAGTVELEWLAPPAGGLVRTVTFVATGGASSKTWNIPVSFAHGSTTGTFSLVDVPAGTANLSAKTAWNLRRRLAVSYTDDRAVVSFTGTARVLAGDINASNSVNVLDYSVMKAQWLSANPISDINGDGQVNIGDYSPMKLNWFVVGDPQ